MYTDYDAEIYFLTDNSMLPNGINSDLRPLTSLYQAAEPKFDEPEISWLASGAEQQPVPNIQPQGEQS